MNTRQYTLLDRCVAAAHSALTTLAGPEPIAGRPNPAEAEPEPALEPNQRLLSGQLMRVNHAGEISAQALYQGQALTARMAGTRTAMEQAANEENDHLAWTGERLRELGIRKSYLNPAWYFGSFVLGATAGLVGDKWSLGFVVETENQVVKHLERHLTRLPRDDKKSRAILEQMRTDEARHATAAIAAGAAALPWPVRHWMRAASKIMTTTARWL